MTKEVDVNIFGRTSVGKTRTALETVRHVSQTVGAIGLSRGNYFRRAVNMLSRSEISPSGLNSKNVQEVLEGLQYRIVDGMLQVLGDGGKPFIQTHENGNTVPQYAAQPLFQESMSDYLDTLRVRLHEEFPIVIVEGRIPADKGISISMTADPGTRIAVKRIECPEVNFMSDDQIAREVSMRDEMDIGSGVLFLRSDAYIINRPDATEKTQREIVECVGELILTRFRDGQMPPTGVIFPSQYRNDERWKGFEPSTLSLEN